MIVGLSWTFLGPELPSIMAGGDRTALGSRSPRAVDRHRGLISKAAKLPPHILASSVSSSPLRASQ